MYSKQNEKSSHAVLYSLKSVTEEQIVHEKMEKCGGVCTPFTVVTVADVNRQIVTTTVAVPLSLRQTEIRSHFGCRKMKIPFLRSASKVNVHAFIIKGGLDVRRHCQLMTSAILGVELNPIAISVRKIR